MSAASWSGDFRRGTKTTATRARRAEPSGRAAGGAGRGCPRVVLPPVPDRERRLAPELPADRAVQKTRAAWNRFGSSSRIENAASVAATKRSRRSSARRRPARPLGYVAQSGATTSSDANFVQPASAAKAPRAPASVDEPEAPDQERRQDRVVRVRARGVLRERDTPPTRTRASPPSRWPPKRQPTSASAEQAEHVERDRR